MRTRSPRSPVVQPLRNYVVGERASEPGEAKMKILIADDHWVVRESLKLVMKKLRQRFEPLEAATFEEAITILGIHPDVDLMLIDLIMPGFEEFAGLQRLRESFPDVPVVVISVHEDADYVLRSISFGVVGYIPKSAGGAEIERALERVLAGEVSYPRTILERTANGHNARIRMATTPQKSMAEAALSSRENDVIRLFGKGLSIARIADHLKLSPHTVRVHLGNIMKKLGLKDRSEALHFAIDLVRGHDEKRRS
jgi:DNA-binding NarL/FixJ family response regulator